MTHFLFSVSIDDPVFSDYVIAESESEALRLACETVCRPIEPLVGMISRAAGPSESGTGKVCQ